MIARIQQFFHELMAAPTTSENGQSVQLAAAALLVELMLADQHIDEKERGKLLALLQQQFQLTASQAVDLLQLAERQVADANDDYQFTRLINDNYTETQKYQLIKALWQLAYADQQLDKYEESFIRKIADLIYVNHSDFIRAKLEARPQ